MSGMDAMQGVVGVKGFTLRGTSAAEGRIRRDVVRIVREVNGAFGARARLCALAGGYARGEGAVEIEQGETRPHNDYDLVVVVEQIDDHDGVRARRAGLLARNVVGVEVDVAVIDEATFLRPPPTLFWLDATRGGLRWLGGDADLLAAQRAIDVDDVPLSEAGRLLANRAFGLALSRLGGEESEALVKARHGHKAVLAAGDALLLAVRRYAFSLRERASRVAQLREAPGVGSWLPQAYQDALRFREDTVGWRPPGGGRREDWFEEVSRQIGSVHLAFEAWRVGAPGDPASFARGRGRLFERKPDARLGDALAALRAWVRRDAPLRPVVGHPRERLARVAVALAYGGPSGREDAARLLGLDAGASDGALRLAMLKLRAVGS